MIVVIVIITSSNHRNRNSNNNSNMTWGVNRVDYSETWCAGALPGSLTPSVELLAYLSGVHKGGFSKGGFRNFCATIMLLLLIPLY